MAVRILLIFIDGLGIGRYDTNSNPCTHPQLKIFNNFADLPRSNDIPCDGYYKSIDATLNFPGLPQSATGQAALLTGVNTANLLGRHLSGFPNQKLRELLGEKSLLTRFSQLGKKAAFINTYRPLFFELGPEALTRFLSVTSIANWKADLKFFNLDDLNAEKSIYHDFSNRELIRKGFKVPEFSPSRAGKILAKVSGKYDFCLYEYFKTDKAGHAQNQDDAVQILIQLEKFILSVLRYIDLQDQLVIVTSDHGNIEDLSVRTHTRNPIPFIAWGRHAEHLVKHVSAIEEIANLLLELN